MQRKFRKVITAIKEHGSVSYAKVATMGGFRDLDLTIIKATLPDDLPLDEKYVQHLLKTFIATPRFFRAFSLSFNRRFCKTNCWRVALKCLLLLHRLIRLFPKDSPLLRDELLWTRYNGLLSLDPCYFKDSSSSCFEYYTIFIRSYARLIDEALDCLSIGTTNMDEDLEEEIDVPKTMPEKMKETNHQLQLLPQLQSLIDRVIDCRPSGPAERSFLVQSAMKHIIRDSFLCYKKIRKHVEILLENLMQMPYRRGVAAFGIYKKASFQAIKLSEFYDWCRSLGLCGAYEYPLVQKIPTIQIQALETFLDGLWQSNEPSSSSEQSPFESGDEECENKEDPNTNIVASVLEMEPLIKFDEIENNVSWEELLEASLSQGIKSRFDPDGYYQSQEHIRI